MVQPMKVTRHLFSFLCLTAVNAKAHLRDVQRKLAGGATRTTCMEDVYGGSLGCTANDIKIVAARNITILDDGCKYPGDTVQFTAKFQVESSASTRYDIGLWFAVDGDQNNDGALRGQCIAATPFYDSDGDFCGDIADGQNPQYPLFTITTVCKGNAQGWLMLPYCSSWSQPGGNKVCSNPTQTIPDVKSKCKCDQFFYVDIKVPISGGTGSGIGDPHFESWSNQKFDYQGICDLVFMHSSEYNNKTGLDIHIRTAEINGTSYISNAVIKIGEDKLEVNEFGTYYYNGELNGPLPDTISDSTLSYSLDGGWIPKWKFTSPRGGIIFVQVFNQMVDVKLSGFLSETISDSYGLLGDFNTGFLVDRNGQWMFDKNAYGTEWQVRDTEPMLFQEVRVPQYPEKCQRPSFEATERRINNLSQVSVEDASLHCKDTGRYFHECVQDLRLSGDMNTVQHYKHLLNVKL
jgi:hypothetical protein